MIRRAAATLAGLALLVLAARASTPQPALWATAPTRADAAELPAQPTPVDPVDPVDSMAGAARPAPLGVVQPAAGPASPPTRVRVPGIGVDASLERLGQLPDGTIAAPDRFDEAGWFASGTQPGQLGPAVIAGHVDSRSGPAVFYRLDELRPGDAVEVVRADGSTVEFRVTAAEQVPKDGFPVAQVYGPVPDAELRLITCGGSFDYQTGHYRSNVVIFAVLVGMRS